MTIKCITFDLDDTLWDCKSVLTHAEKVSYQWFEKYYPRISSTYSFQELIDSRVNYLKSHPEDAYDLTKIRKDWLAQIASECGYSEQTAEDAFDVFWLARNEVTFYDGALAMLEQLSSQYSLGVISNGNADVNHIGIGQYFDFSATVQNAGVAKPDEKIFEHALQLANREAHQTVHIGDHPHYDVIGALDAGLHAIWYNPTQSPWTDNKKPTAIIQHLNEISQQVQRIISATDER